MYHKDDNSIVSAADEFFKPGFTYTVPYHLRNEYHSILSVVITYTNFLWVYSNEVANQFTNILKNYLITFKSQLTVITIIISLIIWKNVRIVKPIAFEYFYLSVYYSRLLFLLFSRFLYLFHFCVATQTKNLLCSLSGLDISKQFFSSTSLVSTESKNII